MPNNHASPGGALKAWRVGKGLSQQAAAELVGTNQSTWSHWECDRRVPSTALAFALSRVTKGKIGLKLWPRQRAVRP